MADGGTTKANATGDGSPGGTMASAFYWGQHVQLLFWAWDTQSLGSYILTLGAVFILALFHVWFGELKKGIYHLSPSPSPPPPPPTTTTTLTTKPTSSFHNFFATLLRHRLTRVVLLAITHILSVASGYFLMLIIMSFNVGVFLSVLAGLTFGFILFDT